MARRETLERLREAIRRRGIKKVPKDVGTGKPFARLKAKLARRPGVTDPGALAASIGRRKFGKRLFGRLGALGRRRAG